MLRMSEATARRIIDAIAMAIDGKPSSAKTFAPAPFSEMAEFDAWGQQSNNSLTETTRTDALTVAYLLLSGGRIPLQGIEVQGAFFRPDKWIIGALVKKNRVTIDTSAKEAVFTPQGWEWIAEVLEALPKAK